LANTYLYKRNLLALVYKANLIPSSYSLEISYTLHLCSQNIWTKRFFFYEPLWLQIFFFLKICFTLFLIYFKYILWTIYQPKIEGLLDQKIRTQYFSRLQPLMSTMTAPIKRETNIQTSQKSTDKRPLFKIKTSRSNHGDHKWWRLSNPNQ
jgi:hypothetical protein